MAHTSSKFKRKRYNLNLNLSEVHDNKKKVKASNKKTPSSSKIKEENKAPEKDSNEDVEINIGDEFDPNEDNRQEDDPFILHLRDDLSPPLHAALSQKPPKLVREIVQWPFLGKLLYFRADVEASIEKKDVKALLSDQNSFASLRPLPDVTKDLTLNDFHIKPQILSNVIKAFAKLNENETLTPVQKELLALICNYHDVYYPEVNLTNNNEVRLIYCVHAINHIIKTRTKILHHNAKLQSRLDVPEEFRDQGLVRPKVLFLVPFRSFAYRIVQDLISVLLGGGGNVMNKKRFLDEYSGDTLLMAEKNPKPPDYQQLFSGNTDDNFKIGLTVTKKCLKLYADFYSSDIIIASPLGLRVLIGTEGEEVRDYDFLSSIELLIMDQTQVFTVQNWEHMLHVMDHMHLQPREAHDTDLSRTRTWALNGWTKYYMQSLVFSSHPMPEISALFNSQLINYGGKIAITNPVVSGSIAQVVVLVPQMFHYISSSSLTEAIDARFQAFVSNILPRFKDPGMKHVMIYIPSYFDFVRLRNYFKKQEMHFVQICEYTKEKKIVRARSKFFHGETQFLLYTERFHFFRRLVIRGIKHLVFYQPPAFPLFYSEICNFLQDVKIGSSGEELNMSINVLYTKYDITQVAGIIGTERATRILASEKPVHMFMTETTKSS